MSISLCLIAPAPGYIVVLQSSKEKEGLKVLGQAVGSVVMITAFLAALCCAAQAVGYKTSSGGWAGMSCPVGGPAKAGKA